MWEEEHNKGMTKSLAVLFDMDGLMLDTERMARGAWTRALAEKGFVLHGDDYLQLLGRTSADAESILGALFGPKLPFREVFDLRQKYYDADIDENGIAIKPGLSELLGFLEERNIPKAVASSTPGWFIQHKLNLVGLAHRFSVCIGGDSVLHGKPAPDLFLSAARLLNVAPADCLVFEDSEAGVRAAHAAHMLPVMVPDLKQPSIEVRGLACHVLTSLNEAVPVVEYYLQHRHG